MRLVDAHCHLEHELLSERLDVIIADAGKAGIVKIITSTVKPDDWDLARQTANSYPEVEFSLGIHPWFAALSDIEKVDSLHDAAKRGAVAIGEIGLDKKIENPDMEIQQQIFEKQLEAAREINLPVIIHCRAAFNELIESINRVKLPEAGGLIHSFSGSVELAETFSSMGLYFSMGGVLTYKKSRKRIEVLRKIYPERFLLETDSPDFLPVHLSDEPNVPSNILYNLKGAAEILEVPEEEVAEKTTACAVKLFNLSL